MNTILFTSANDGYRRMLGAMLVSLIDHNREQLDRLELVIMDTGLSAQTCEHLQTMAREAGLRLTLLCVDEESFQTILGLRPQNISVYARLLVPYLLDEAHERALYFDSDLICLNAIPSLDSVDLKGKMFAAVQDPMRNFYYGIAQYQNFGFTGEERYFNSGVMLIDASKWRESNISRRVIEHTYQHECAHWDQTALNVLAHDQWTELDRSWNELHRREPGKTLFRHFALAKPIHFHRPMIDSQDVFLNYLDTTPWRGWRPKPRWRIKLEKQLLCMHDRLRQLRPSLSSSTRPIMEIGLEKRILKMVRR